MKAWFTVPGPDGRSVRISREPCAGSWTGQVVVAVRAAGTNRGELIRGAQLRVLTRRPARASGHRVRRRDRRPRRWSERLDAGDRVMAARW